LIPGKMLTEPLHDFTERKTHGASSAQVHTLVTTETGPLEQTLCGIGNDWTRRHYDGDFRLLPLPSVAPAITLVFVQSRDGNTEADDPEDLGGGTTDKHLLYEGLSRAAADAVLAGTSTAAGRSAFFSVWHPEIVALRHQLGLARHPAQVVVSATGHIDLDDSLLFNVPEVPTFLLAGRICRDRWATRLAERPWITVISIEPHGLRGALSHLRAHHGIRRISAIGGRTTASNLVDADLVQDLCLTTSPLSGGKPDTPFYTGRRTLSFETIVQKREVGTREPISFAHLAFVPRA
jgi:riboflavin biosynthesis pyrimidine reductase